MTTVQSKQIWQNAPRGKAPLRALDKHMTACDFDGRWLACRRHMMAKAGGPRIFSRGSASSVSCPVC